jgi:peptidoglycan hydrolase CwlO-like protein
MIRNRARSRRLVSAVPSGARLCTLGRTRGPAGRGGGARGPLSVLATSLVCLAVLCGAILLGTSPDPAEAIPTDLQSVRLFGDAKTQVDDLTVQAGYVQAEIDALDVELERSSETYNQLQVRLDEVNVQMATLRRDLDEAQSDHAYRIQKFEERLCALYKTGGRGDELLGLLVASHGVEDLVNRIRVAASLADQDQRILENLTKSSDRLNGVLAEIDGTKREQLSLRRQIQDQREQIRTALAEREGALEGLDTEISGIIEAERARQEEEQTRLQRALQALLDGARIYDGPLPQTDSEILNQFLETAAYYLGIPYVWAGDRPSTGFDCSGFTQYVYAQHGVYLPHYSGFQAQMGVTVGPTDEIQPGDLLAFGFPVHHVGIYIGNGLFIHAPRTGDVIKISHLREKNNLSAVRRFELQPRTGAPALW